MPLVKTRGDSGGTKIAGEVPEILTVDGMCLF